MNTTTTEKPTTPQYDVETILTPAFELVQNPDDADGPISFRADAATLDKAAERLGLGCGESLLGAIVAAIKHFTGSATDIAPTGITDSRKGGTQGWRVSAAGKRAQAVLDTLGEE